MRDLPLERAEHRFEAAFYAQNRVGDVGIYRQNFSPAGCQAISVPATCRRA